MDDGRHTKRLRPSRDEDASTKAKRPLNVPLEPRNVAKPATESRGGPSKASAVQIPARPLGQGNLAGRPGALPAKGSLKRLGVASGAPTDRLDIDSDVLKVVEDAYEANNVDEADQALARALTACAENPAYPNKQLFQGALAASRKLPQVALLPKSYDILVDFLGSGAGGTGSTVFGGLAARGKRGVALPLLACNLLNRALSSSSSDWPQGLLKAYIGDLFGSRHWAEHERARNFVGNLGTVFPPLSDAQLAALADLAGGPGVGGPVRPGAMTGPLQSAALLDALKEEPEEATPRYTDGAVQQWAREELLDKLRHFVNGSTLRDNPRLVVRLLIMACRWAEGRALAASHVEALVSSTPNQRYGILLLNLLLESIQTAEEGDVAAAVSLMQMRLKVGHAAQQAHVMETILSRRPEYVQATIRAFMQQDMLEKGKGRSMAHLTGVAETLVEMRQSGSGLPLEDGQLEGMFALCLQEAMAGEETRLRVRDFIRRLVRSCFGSLHMGLMCKALFRPWAAMSEQPPAVKEAWLAEILAATCLIQLQAVLMVQAVEAGGAATSDTEGFARSGGHQPSLHTLLDDVADARLEAMIWSAREVTELLGPGVAPASFQTLLSRLLFLEDNRHSYISPGETFAEAEEAAMRVLMWEVPLREDTLTHIVVMGLTDSPLLPGDALGLIEGLLQRSAGQALSRGSLPEAGLTDNFELVHGIFRLSVYKPPPAPLPPPPGMEPALPLAVPDLWWAAVRCTALLASLSFPTIGHNILAEVPTVRAILEMVATGSQAYPIVRSPEALRQFEELTAKIQEEDAAVQEKLYRNIQECGAQWQQRGEGWIRLDHSAGPRVPPLQVVKQLMEPRGTENLGSALRACTDPDILGSITANQAFEEAWEWLEDVLGEDPKVISRLPKAWRPALLLQCLVRSPPDSLEGSARQLELQPPPDAAIALTSNIARMIRSGLGGEDNLGADPAPSSAVYFFSNLLSNRSPRQREAALRALNLIFGERMEAPRAAPLSSLGDTAAPSVDTLDGGPSAAGHQWIEEVVRILNGKEVLAALLEQLARGLQRERDLPTAASHLISLARHAPPEVAFRGLRNLVTRGPAIVSGVLGPQAPPGAAKAALDVLKAVQALLKESQTEGREAVQSTSSAVQLSGPVPDGPPEEAGDAAHEGPQVPLDAKGVAEVALPVLAMVAGYVHTAGGAGGRPASDREALLKQYQEALQSVLGTSPSPNCTGGPEGASPVVQAGLLPDLATFLKGDADMAARLAACPEPCLASLGLQALDPAGILRLVLTGAFTSDPAILLQTLDGLPEEDIVSVTPDVCSTAMTAESLQALLQGAVAALRSQCQGGPSKDRSDKQGLAVPDPGAHPSQIQHPGDSPQTVPMDIDGQAMEIERSHLTGPRLSAALVACLSSSAPSLTDLALLASEVLLQGRSKRSQGVPAALAEVSGKTGIMEKVRDVTGIEPGAAVTESKTEAQVLPQVTGEKPGLVKGEAAGTAYIGDILGQLKQRPAKKRRTTGDAHTGQDAADDVDDALKVCERFLLQGEQVSQASEGGVASKAQEAAVALWLLLDPDLSHPVSKGILASALKRLLSARAGEEEEGGGGEEEVTVGGTASEVQRVVGWLEQLVSHMDTHGSWAARLALAHSLLALPMGATMLQAAANLVFDHVDACVRNAATWVGWEIVPDEAVSSCEGQSEKPFQDPIKWPHELKSRRGGSTEEAVTAECLTPLLLSNAEGTALLSVLLRSSSPRARRVALLSTVCLTQPHLATHMVRFLSAQALCSTISAGPSARNPPLAAAGGTRSPGPSGAAVPPSALDSRESLGTPCGTHPVDAPLGTTRQAGWRVRTDERAMLGSFFLGHDASKQCGKEGAEGASGAGRGAGGVWRHGGPDSAQEDKNRESEAWGILRELYPALPDRVKRILRPSEDSPSDVAGFWTALQCRMASEDVVPGSWVSDEVAGAVREISAGNATDTSGAEEAIAAHPALGLAVLSSREGLLQAVLQAAGSGTPRDTVTSAAILHITKLVKLVTALMTSLGAVGALEHALAPAAQVAERGLPVEDTTTPLEALLYLMVDVARTCLAVEDIAVIPACIKCVSAIGEALLLAWPLWDGIGLDLVSALHEAFPIVASISQLRAKVGPAAVSEGCSRDALIACLEAT